MDLKLSSSKVVRSFAKTLFCKIGRKSAPTKEIVYIETPGRVSTVETSSASGPSLAEAAAIVEATVESEQEALEQQQPKNTPSQPLTQQTPNQSSPPSQPNVASGNYLLKMKNRYPV